MHGIRRVAVSGWAERLTVGHEQVAGHRRMFIRDIDRCRRWFESAGVHVEAAAMPGECPLQSVVRVV